MKTKTFSILFALVMILSLSAGVFAQDFTETWDEETVLTVFNDLDIMFPDLFADIDSDFLFVESDSVAVIPTSFPKDGDDYAAKAPIDSDASMKATFDPCGDGLIKFDVTIKKAADESGTASNYYGPKNTTYIRSIDVKVDGTDAVILKCDSTGGDSCRSVKFNGKGEAHITGYIYVPKVLKAEDSPSVEMTIVHSTYMTALWDVEKEADITVSGTATATKNNYCQASLEEFEMGGFESVRARYDENTGEARFQATIRNYKSTDKVNYVIPADILVLKAVETAEGSGSESGEGEGEGDGGAEGDEPADGTTEESTTTIWERYTNYVCKYTVYNVPNAAPRTDYCKFGEGIALAPNAAIRFDITIDHLNGVNTGDLPFVFRVGGMTKFVGNVAPGIDDINDTEAAFIPVDYPCPPVTRMSVMDPLKPFMTFYGMEVDAPIAPSGAYGVYQGGVWGLYQKCGRFAYMAVRLRNDGVKDETINLKKVAVAINGGSPMEWCWVLTSVPETDDNLIDLAPGEDVVLFLRAKVTDYPSQMNSDLAITGAVNFLDYGLYITGKVYSDHNNTNCVAP